VSQVNSKFKKKLMSPSSKRELSAAASSGSHAILRILKPRVVLSTAQIVVLLSTAPRQPAQNDE
jgi:hypothetical protein